MKSQLRVALIGALVVATVAAAVLSARFADPDRVAGHLGPTPGPSSEGHVAAKHAYLDRLAAEDPNEPASALVSLKTLVRGTDAQRMASVAEPVAVAVRFPGNEPELQLVRTTIPGALADRASDLRNEYEEEIKALEASESTELVAQRKAELAKIDANCICVYAFAVERADVAELDALAKRPEVKLVDVPEPVTDDLAGWQLLPIVPKTAAK
jgi:hypothetical protein